MKVQREFSPVCITLDTPEEVRMFAQLARDVVQWYRSDSWDRNITQRFLDYLKAAEVEEVELDDER